MNTICLTIYNNMIPHIMLNGFSYATSLCNNLQKLHKIHKLKFDFTSYLFIKISGLSFLKQQS